MSSQLPVVIDIARARGDTFSFTFVVKESDGTPIDVTGFSFFLTVDPAEDPPDPSGNLFTLNGVITDGPAGKVTFTLSAVEADQPPSDYFFDVQMVDLAAAIRTIVKGGWTVQQDITKV